MKHQEVMKLIPQIKEALATNREIAYFDASNQKLFTVTDIKGPFIGVISVDNSDTFGVTLTSPDIRRDCFAFGSTPAVS